MHNPMSMYYERCYIYIKYIIYNVWSWCIIWYYNILNKDLEIIYIIV